MKVVSSATNNKNFSNQAQSPSS